MPTSSLDAAAHVIQLALTPVFLLSGIAALLNIFAIRLGRVSDQVDAECARSGCAKGDLRRRTLRWRSLALETAVVLAALAAALTCGVVLAILLGEVSGRGAARWLFVQFGAATVSTMGSLLAFVVEMLLAGRSIRDSANGK